MYRIVSHMYPAVTSILFLFGGILGLFTPVDVAIASSNQRDGMEVNHEQSGEEYSNLVLRYAKAMAGGRVEEWARLDLGCIDRQQKAKGSLRNQNSDSSTQACWDGTLAAHRNLVADETEHGIFGALGRGSGFGLIHASHQHADFWKDYPPALAVSPAVIREDTDAPVPVFRVEKVSEPRSAGLVIEGVHKPAEVQKINIDVSVSYPDPMTAPLALLPDEPWWASPVIRKYAPVKNLLARFEVVRGLKSLGYAVDHAVINDALPGSPIIAKPSAPGILPSSPRWWNRTQDQELFEKGIEQAQKTGSFQERVKKYQRLLLLDPKEPHVNGLYGMDLYLAFLREGLAKGKVQSKDESISQSLGELYWNIQAQTWRQEFTEVAVGHSFAADVFYQATPALEIAIDGGQGHAEMRRRLGAIYRWNNDTKSALGIHEQMLNDVPPSDDRKRSQILSEIAWDRVQWLSWNRRYEHPWMTQAREEAEQALNLAKTPIDKIMAGEALVVLDAIAVPRDQSRLQEHVAVVRFNHDQLSGVVGMWDHLVGNDLVKSLIPEGTQVHLPEPKRSPEVMPLDVHHTIQDHNFLKTWSFDQGPAGGLPSGFSVGSSQGGTAGQWQIKADSKAPSLPNVLTQTSPCGDESCFQVLLRDESVHELPDIVTYVRQISSSPQGEAGIVLAAQDALNFYSVTLNSSTNQLSIHRVKDGNPILLGTGDFKLKPGPWHVLRVEVTNYAHVDHPRLVIYVDGFETLVTISEPIQGKGYVGLVTKGDMVAQFDRFRVIEMMTNKTFSKPAAY